MKTIDINRIVSQMGIEDKYFVNLCPESEEYLWIFRLYTNGRFVDEIGRGAYHEPLDGIQEISKEQYGKIMDCHCSDGNPDFDGDWDNFESYVLQVVNG